MIVHDETTMVGISPGQIIRTTSHGLHERALWLEFAGKSCNLATVKTENTV